MKYSMILLIIVSNYCMGMDITQLLNPKENTLNVLDTGWQAKPPYFQNSDSDQDTQSDEDSLSDQDIDKGNTTDVKCPTCEKRFATKGWLTSLRCHMFMTHKCQSLDPELKDKIKNCKINAGKSVKCIMENCKQKLNARPDNKEFIIKRHLADVHFKEELNEEIEKNQTVVKKRINVPSEISNCLSCPIENCPTQLHAKRQSNLGSNLILHLFNKHLEDNAALEESMEQQWHAPKSKTQIYCCHKGCIKEITISRHTSQDQYKSILHSLQYHYAVTHCAEQLESCCGQQSIKDYVNGHANIDYKKQKTHKILS